MSSSAGSTWPSVGVVVPCLNEASSLPYVFARMPTEVAEVILVDGDSTDGSAARARELWPDVAVVQQTRTGKGNALACGFTASAAEILITLDADGSADPAEIPRFVEALVGGADFAKGSRFVGGGGSDDITRLRRLGNRGFTALVNRLFGTRFTDLCYGYNAFWRTALPAFDLPDVAALADDAVMLPGDGFEIETLLVLRAATAGMSIAEVASHEAHRLHGVSNLNAFADGRRVLSTIMDEWRLAARREPGESVSGSRSRPLSAAPTSPGTPISPAAAISPAAPMSADTPISLAAPISPAGPVVPAQRRHGSLRDADAHSPERLNARGDA